MISSISSAFFAEGQLAFAAYFSLSNFMSALEIAELCESLPPEKRDEVADFARFLLSRQQDETWESRIASASPRPRLDAFVSESTAEGDALLDLQRL